jgi:adenosylhomocysteinase
MTKADAIETGRRKIEWVRRHSPVLDGYVRSLMEGGALKGKRVAVVVHLEAKTAFLAKVLADVGADVVVGGSNPFTTRQDVVEALRADGLTVIGREGGDYTDWENDLVGLADTAPDIVIDDGAELTLRMAKFRPKLYARLHGVTEETTTGTKRLMQLEQAGMLKFPALTANNARCKYLFDNRYGTGQTTIQALLALTNMQAAGMRLAVVGYGWVGRGIATYAKALGAQVGVIELDPVKALEALMDGHVPGSAEDILPHSSVVITATGGIRAIGAHEFPYLADGVILANAGHHDHEIDVPALREMADAETPVRPQISQFSIEGKKMNLLSEGALVNIAGGSGHPVEIMDLTFAVQGIGAYHLASEQLPVGVHVLPKALDDAIASARLRAGGITLGSAQLHHNETIADLLDGGHA